MTWKFLATVNLTDEWQFTSSCDGEFFRFQYPIALPITVQIAQAQTVKSTELWEVREVIAKPELEIFQIEKPIFFSHRRLALRSIAPFELKTPFVLRIEVWSVPLSRTNSFKPVASTSATATSVAASTTSVLLLAANENRKGVTLWNSSTALLRVEFAAPAPNTSTFANVPYAVEIGAGDYYELPFNYTGTISGIWAAANGNCLVREFV